VRAKRWVCVKPNPPGVWQRNCTDDDMALDGKQLSKPAKKLRKLVGKLSRQPAPKTVHDLRTNSRRFEAAFHALDLGDQGVPKSVLKGLRRCRKRAGKVRDMDVLTEYASKVHAEGEEECRVRLLEHLGAQRKKYANRLYAEVRRLRSSLRKELKRTPPILDKLARVNGDDPGENVFGPKAAGTAVTLAVQLGAPPRLNRGNLHPYRLKVKELRSVLQMAAGKDPQFVSDLGKVKDAIGEWHDWQELVSIAEQELDHGNQCGLPAELKRIAGRKYDRALALAQGLRTHYLRPQKDLSPGPSSGVPREPVWEAIAMLAA